MKQLFELGLNQNDIEDMINLNPDIANLDKEIIELITLLKEVGCKDRHIKNILISNPMYLSRSKTDVLKLIELLKELGITNLEITFDTNPWLLNKDVFEINEFIKEQKELGLNMYDIVDMIDNGMLGEFLW